MIHMQNAVALDLKTVFSTNFRTFNTHLFTGNVLEVVQQLLVVLVFRSTMNGLFLDFDIFPILFLLRKRD